MSSPNCTITVAKTAADKKEKHRRYKQFLKAQNFKCSLPAGAGGFGVPVMVKRHKTKRKSR